MLKKLSAMILVALILIMPLSVLSAAAAAPTTSVSFASYKYSETEKRMVPKTTFKPGEYVYIGVLFERTENLGGYTIDMVYDNTNFTFEQGKLLDMTGVSDSEFVSNEVNGTVYITWETTQNYTAEGIVLYVPFSVNSGVVENKKYHFTSDITEVFKNDATQTLFKVTIAEQAAVRVTPQEVPQEFLDLVTPLLQITYNPTGNPALPQDSMGYIDSAMAYYTNPDLMNQTQKEAFHTQYPDLYEALSNARNRYYELANKEANALIEAEVQNFLSTYATLLSKNINDLTTKDKDAVEAMSSAYAVLSEKAIVKLGENNRTKVRDIKNRMDKLLQDTEDLETALQEVAEYRETYKNYVSEQGYNEILPTFKDSYTVYYPNITEANIVYESMLSPMAQEMLKVEKERIDTFLALVEQYTKEDAEKAALVEKINDFVSRYVYVFTLNKLNVGIGDESAIRMVIDSYNAITDEALKEALKAKITPLNGCLEAIEVLKNATDGDVVIVPGEDDNTPGTNAQTNTVEKIINRIYRSSSVFRMAFVPLLILLMISILCLATTIFILQNLKKKNLAEGSAMNETV